MPTSRFISSLRNRLSLAGGPVETRLLHEYGSIFVTRAKPPDRVIFADEIDVARFQAGLEIEAAEIGEFVFELQREAMAALKDAIAETESMGVTLTARGEDSGRRNFQGTVDLWRSRVEPALDHWVGAGRLSVEEASKVRSLSPIDQVSEVLRLEEEGIFFAKDLSKSILYSVAPPGASQHLSMLAFDVAEFQNSAVRRILAGHGWHQTVVSDLPHFTFLGMQESELPAMGLRSVENAGQIFWLPDLTV